MKELTVDRCRKQILRLKKCISQGYVSINERDYLQALEIALPILEQQERGEGEWIDWKGGECPVPKDFVIEFKLRGGGRGCGKSKYFVWAHDEHPDDIIAYRIIPERATNQNGEQ